MPLLPIRRDDVLNRHQDRSRIEPRVKGETCLRPVDGWLTVEWPVSGTRQNSPATTPSITTAAVKKVNCRPTPSATSPQISAPTVIEPVKVTRYGNAASADPNRQE